MKKMLLVVTVSSLLALTGCDNDNTKSTMPTSVDAVTDESGADIDTGGSSVSDETAVSPVVADTVIAFDILSEKKSLITPSFLAMDSVDGTLATDGMVGQIGYATDISDPATAMGKTDGWSTTQPFVIQFKGKPLDPATASAGFVLIESFNPTIGQAGAAKIQRLEPGTDFVASSTDTTLTVVLLRPLNPASDYMFGVTTALKDVDGKSVGSSPSYVVLKHSEAPPSPALYVAQAITHKTEEALAQSADIDQKDIIFSSWFTTASVGVVLHATKGAVAKSIEAILDGKDAGASTLKRDSLSSEYGFIQGFMGYPEAIEFKGVPP